MNNKHLSILSFILAISIAFILVLWQNGTLDSNKKFLSNGVYLKKNNNRNYSALSGNRQKLVAHSVDSLIISKRYGTMIYGIGQGENSKFWY